MLDPLHGDGYQFWSGIGATAAPFLVGLGFWLAPTRCHELRCRRRAVKAHPQHGYPVCARHLP
jgi:hypothetical protein